MLQSEIDFFKCLLNFQMALSNKVLALSALLLFAGTALDVKAESEDADEVNEAIVEVSSALMLAA